MTTNEIEKQLRFKSRKEIKECADTLAHELQQFGKNHTGSNRRCIAWHSKREKPHAKYNEDHPCFQEVSDPFVTLDWKELSQLIVRNMEENWLDQMVERKAKELLTKIDLLG